MQDNEIKKIIDDTVSATILRLKAAGILRDGEKSAIEKTEELLRQYNTLKETDQPYARTLVAEIEKCFDELRNDPYIDIIRLYYFDGLTNAAAAREMFCDERTARRNRKKLVRAFSVRLVSDEFIRELLM